MPESEDFSEEQQEVISIINNEVVSPFKGEIQKLEGKIESLEERLPSEVEKVKDVDKFIKKNEAGILDFWTESCVPCFQYNGALERVARNGRTVGKVNIKNESGLEWIREEEEKSNIAIPLILSFKDGEIIQKITGAPTDKGAYDLIKWMSQRLKVPTEEYEKTFKNVKRIAEAKGWRLNPKKSIVEGLVAALTYNRLNEEKQYCPCKSSRVPENICPCREYEDFPGAEKRLKSEGKCCYCGLFCSEEYYKKYKKKKKEVVNVGEDSG